VAKTFFVAAMNQALAIAMEEDSTVIALGEDIDRSIFGVTKGLIDVHGPNRIRKTPISEATFVGSAIGAAASGLRPFVNVMFSSFFYVAMDQIANQAARLRYMSGGQLHLPIVYFAGTGLAGSAAAQHSENPHAILMQTGGLKVVMPSTPHDAKGLLLASIRDDNPVIFLSDLRLSRQRAEVPEEPFEVPLGKGDIKRSGNDVTVVALGSIIHTALAAASNLEKEGISVEIVDPRSLVPFDWETLALSVHKTGRLVVADPARKLCGLAAEVIAGVTERCWKSLRSQPIRLTWPDVPVPFSPTLEAALDITATDIERAIRTSMASENPANG